MIYITETLLKLKKSPKLHDCRILEFDGSLEDCLREFYPSFFENGMVTHGIFEEDRELTVMYSGRLLRMYRPLPSEENSLRCAVISNSLQMSLEAQNRRCYEEQKKK